MNRMREKLEVERLLATPWVMEAMQALLLQAPSAHTSTLPHSSTASCPAGGASMLAAPVALLDRITKELKIHRRQASVIKSLSLSGFVLHLICVFTLKLRSNIS